MGFSLDKIVPWGRSYQEYIAMFALSATDLQRSLLGCGDGPASFNAVLTQNGGRIVSIDPIYIFTVEQIKNRIAQTYPVVLEQLQQNQKDFIWDAIPSVAELGRIRMAAMELCLSDYEAGIHAGRYIAGELPQLPFQNRQFDLALSSHFLFLYSEHFSTEFHLQSVQEMLRVATEIRVFPLLALNGTPSPHLPVVIEFFNSQNFAVEIRKVDYEFQRGADEMLIISHSAR
jgi:hypothetical protein